MNRRLAAIVASGALMLGVGGGLAACGGSSSGSSTSPRPTHTSAPAVNYKHQYLADVAPSNTAADSIGPTDGWTSPAMRAYKRAVATFGRTLLTQTWPANASSDVHALALNSLKLRVDIVNKDATAFKSDDTTTIADVTAVRTELGLHGVATMPSVQPPAPPATPAPAPAPAPAPPAAVTPSGLRDVGTGVNGEEVYANSNTSDAFALNVESAYVEGGYWYQSGASSFTVYSPVTGESYSMYSASAGDPVIVTGGNNALVEFSL
jgi:hypothetical protein